MRAKPARKATDPLTDALRRAQRQRMDRDCKAWLKALARGQCAQGKAG